MLQEEGKKILPFRILFLARLSLKSKGQRKTFNNKQKPRELTASGPAL